MIFTAKKELAQVLSADGMSAPEDLLKLIEIPKLFEHGHLSLPLFTLAKKQNKNPMQWCQELAEIFSKKSLDFISSVKPVGGFLNFTLKAEYLNGLLFESLKNPHFFHGHLGHGKTLVIDYASPNVAKPMHIGHMRASIVGQAIRNLAATQGFKVIGVNHLGDWGTQFGKLCWAYQHWGDQYAYAVKPIDALLKMYVRFHEEAEKHPEMEKEAAALFKKLEDEDVEVTKIWRLMIEYSMEDFNRLFKKMHVNHDVVLGESFYNDKLEDVVHRLEARNLLQESEGARVVFFADVNMPPCIIKKSDGASIYATRDLAAAIYRHEVQKADTILCVVGVEQTLHFKQVFAVLKMMGYDWAESCHHISFGRYRFKDGKMSSRSGKVIFMEDVINEAEAQVQIKVEEKKPALGNKERVVSQVALGAVFFNDLMNDRVKDVEFDWDRLTSTEGDSGPFVQYTNVRCKSILRKYAKAVPAMPLVLMDSAEEQKLIFSLLRFAEVLENSYKMFKPNILAQYLLELCSHFSHFYHKCRILGEDAKVESSRITLVAAVEKTLETGLKILNIESPEAM